MSEHTDPTSKTAKVIEGPPYICAACGQPASDIMCTVVSGLAVFWHDRCKAVINVQLMEVPRQARSSIVVPGGVH